jgi:mono/diheme cytochrome c family protein
MCIRSVCDAALEWGLHQSFGLETFMMRCKPAPFAAVALLIGLVALAGCKASQPGKVETKIAEEAKELAIGGKDQVNPTPDNPETQKRGAEHFQHHCGICHGPDGQNTGVPFATRMSPPVADLASPEVQKYKDGQLKWIVENGIRLSGMPGWEGVLSDDDMWSIVRYIRHLPPKGSLGASAIFKESERKHEAAHATEGRR